jgi:hypothetical protein
MFGALRQNLSIDSFLRWQIFLFVSNTPTDTPQIKIGIAQLELEI